MSIAGTYRRVVTGLDGEGRSCVIIDSEIPHNDPTPTGLAWRTAAVPADNSGSEDIVATEPFTFEMMHGGGTTFIVTEYEPGLGAEPFWHATDTIDYIVILKGEVVMKLETGDVRLKHGDFIVDRGVIHSWHNDTDETTVAAVVTVPAHPVGPGKTV